MDLTSNTTHYFEVLEIKDITKYDWMLHNYHHRATLLPARYGLFAKLFNEDLMCAAKLARLATMADGNKAVMILGAPPVS
jgi:hypothetical protein